MVSYAQMIASAMPFFFSRGGDAFGSKTQILFYLQNAIQDAYNIDNATFTYKNLDTSQFVTDSKGNHVFKADFAIRKIQQITGYDKNNYPTELTPTLYVPIKDCDGWVKFTTGEKEIMVADRYLRIEVTYVSDYEWIDESQITKPIPLPNRYMPAIMKLLFDWASPVNLMASESQQVDFYSHAMSRINQLATEDSLTDHYKINPHR